jgi:hypothetical protein
MGTTGMGLLLLLLLALPAPAAGQPEENPLAPLEYFIGTWVNEQTNAAGETTLYQVFEYRWGLEGKYVLGRSVTRAGQMTLTAETVLGWDAEKQEVVGWSFASDGSIAVTRGALPADGKMRVAGELFGGLDPGPARFDFTLTSEESYELAIEVLRDGEWKPHGRARFTRRDASAEASPSPITPLHGQMAALAPLLGRWQQEGEGPAGKYRLIYIFRLDVGGHFVRTEMHIALGDAAPALHALSFIGHHAGRDGLVQYGWSADGNVMEAGVTPDGSEIVVEGTMHSTPPRQLRITYRRAGDTLETDTAMLRDGEYVSMGQGALQRVRP